MEGFTARLKGLLPRRIWRQILLLLIIPVVLPPLVLGCLLIRTGEQAVKTSVVRDHQEIVRRAGIEIEGFLEAPRRAMLLTAALAGQLRDTPWRQETALVELSLRYPILQRVSLLNRDGRETASSELGTPLVDHADEPAVLSALQGEAFMSEVFLSEEHLPQMIWTAPVIQLGRVVGVVRAQVNLRGIWDIVDGIRVGETGRAYLMDGRGRLLSHPDKKKILTDRDAFRSEGMREILRRVTGSREDVDAQGRPWLLSFAAVPGTGWKLVIYQSSREAFAFLQAMKAQAWAIILLSLAALAAISVGLSRLLSRPLHQLIAGTRRIADGDWDHPFPSQRSDELGELFRAHNDMMRKLKDARHKEKLSVIGQAAAGIAHQLKNSLVLVNTYIQLLPEQGRDRRFIDELVEVVPRELDTWRAMLQELMDYSRSADFDLRPLDVRQLIKSVILPVMALFRENQKSLDVQVQDALPLINGDEERLRQALLNILGNAYEATPAGQGVDLNVYGAVSEDGQLREVCLEVIDRGEGIPEERMAQIFEPFFTTKPGGLGLGLTLCREVVDRHGGRMTVESRNHEGTIVRIFLPAFSDTLRSRLLDQEANSGSSLEELPRGAPDMTPG